MANDNQKSTAPFTNPLKSRYSSNTVNEMEEFSTSFQNLQNTIIQQVSSDLSATYLTILHVTYSAPGFYDDWDAMLALKSNSTFTASNRDAIYGIPYDSYVIKKGFAGVLIGVLHSEVLNATYHCVGIDLGTMGVFNSNWLLDTPLKGSALRYIPNDKNADEFFAIDYFPPGMCSMSKYPQWCIEYSENDFTTNNINVDLYERVYGVYETKVGPYSDNLIRSEMIVFDI